MQAFLIFALAAAATAPDRAAADASTRVAVSQLTPAGSALKILIEESERAHRTLHPLESARGETEDALPAFVDPLSDVYAGTLRANKIRELEQLRMIDRNALSPNEQIAYDVFLHRTREAVDFIESGLFDLQRQAPLNPSFGLHVSFPDYMSAVGRFETLSDYETGLERMVGFSAYMDSAVVRLREGIAAGRLQPKLIAQNVLKQVDAILATPVEESPFYAPVKRFPADIGERQRARLRTEYRAAVQTRVYPAYLRWREFLSETYFPAATDAPGRWAMVGGLQLYAAEVARHTTTRMTAEEIHQLGLFEVERIRKEMETTRQDIGFAADLDALFEHIRSDPRFYYTDPRQLIAHFEAIEARTWARMDELFSRRPKAEFEVRPLPAIGDQRGTGYYRAGPPDASQPGILYFNMSMLNTRPIPTLETLLLHEGIPGHHYQRSLVQEDTTLPPLLRFGSSTAYTEGWGLYAESLGKDLGLFTDPYQWFGRLDMEMLRAVRLVVDTGIHAKQWSRQQAIDYLLANTSMAPRDVAVEVDRYISYPGQATAYKIGELKIQQLRRRAQEQLGENFDIREFHDQVLDTGALPLEVLEAKIDRWLAGAM